MTVLHILLPILVGAIIGYCTNYIAIKMLFRPQKEVWIGKIRVPFTPGIVPKNQKRLAKAIGNAVGGHLLNLEALKANFERNRTKEKLATKLTDAMYESRVCLQEFFATDAHHDETVEKFSQVLTGAVMEKVRQVDWKPIIAQIGQESFGELLQHKMVSMLLSEERLDSIYGRIAVTLQKYLDDNGDTLVEDAICQNVRELEGRPIGEMVQTAVSKEGLERLLTNLIETIAQRYGTALLGAVDISDIVSQRVESMDVAEMERLAMSVMSRELQAVINLGALIGAVIGVVNIFW